MSHFPNLKHMGLESKEITLLFVFWCLCSCCHCLASFLLSSRELLVSLTPASGILFLREMKIKLPLSATVAIVTAIPSISAHHLQVLCKLTWNPDLVLRVAHFTFQTQDSFVSEPSALTRKVIFLIFTFKETGFKLRNINHPSIRN